MRLQPTQATLVPADRAPLTGVMHPSLWRGGRLGPLTPIARGVRDAGRMATSRWRALPDFLVIGAQKSGTTSLYEYLSRHPQVDPAIAKGVHYFEEHYCRGLDWYRSRFPFRTAGRITGEATPDYLFYPSVPERVIRDLPAVKLVAVLRDPVERACSQYHHERALGFEDLSLRAALAAEPDRLRGEEERVRTDADYVSFPLLHYSYRSRGLYAQQIERWLALVPRDRLLVLQAERLYANPLDVTAETFAFLGLPPHLSGRFPILNARAHATLDPEPRAELRDFFREPNERLFRLLGTRFEWE